MYRLYQILEIKTLTFWGGHKFHIYKLRESNIGDRIWSYNLSQNVKALYSDMTSQNKYTISGG